VIIDDNVDDSALDFLRDITVDYSKDYATFTISFHFAENEFFTNSVLTKTYTVAPNLLTGGGMVPCLIRSEGSRINWNAGKDYTSARVQKKQVCTSGPSAGQVLRPPPGSIRSNFNAYLKCCVHSDIFHLLPRPDW
jgi:nucleosome assembly protein 1-like 1